MKIWRRQRKLDVFVTDEERTIPELLSDLNNPIQSYGLHAKVSIDLQHAPPSGVPEDYYVDRILRKLEKVCRRVLDRAQLCRHRAPGPPVMMSSMSTGPLTPAPDFTGTIHLPPGMALPLTLELEGTEHVVELSDPLDITWSDPPALPECPNCLWRLTVPCEAHKDVKVDVAKWALDAARAEIRALEEKAFRAGWHECLKAVAVDDHYQGEVCPDCVVTGEDDAWTEYLKDLK